MAGELSAILTSSQNIASALGNATQAYLNVQGVQTSLDIDAATLVYTGAGRVAMVSITTAGSANGTIYDANDATTTTGKIYMIPNTIGVVFVNMPVLSGIVVTPGSGQVVSISYSALPRPS